MDCFASLAMTTKRDFTFSRRNAPELWEKSLSLERKRAQGMPDARCTRGLVCNVHKEVRTRAYRAAEAIQHSLRNGFTANIALSPATNSSCHRRQRIIGSSQTRLGYENLRRLDTSNGCQDYTVLPYAATSFVCTL